MDIMMSGNKEFTNLPMSVAMIPMIFDAFPPFEGNHISV